MTDSTTDIDALLRIWSVSPLEDHRRYCAAITALVAERDALKQRVAELESHKSVSVRLLIEERDALRKRVAELEAHPPASDLRERLVCAALTGLCADPSVDLDEQGCLSAVAVADRTLAAMRKGESHGK